MDSPIVSVVITTRSRPEEFEKALISVLNQTLTEMEIVVVVDGITESYREAYEALLRKHANNIICVKLPYRERGHGPSFARNEGVNNSKGNYVAFLDDDDIWTDNEHLARFANHVAHESNEPNLQLYITHQKAYKSNSELVTGPIWVEDLIPALKSEQPEFVDIEWLLKSNGFPHLNTLIVRKTLFMKLGGFDENLRYEEDRDFYYRVIDCAEKILFTPYIIGAHYVPEQKSSASSIGKETKYLNQLASTTKLLVYCKSNGIKDRLRQNGAYTYQRLSDSSRENGQMHEAAYFSKASLALRFSPRYAVKALIRIVAGWFQPPSKS